MLPASSSRTIMTTLSAASGPGPRASFISQTSAPTVPSAPSRTKVRSPLTLDSPSRRGLRGGRLGGGAGSPSAGLLARLNRLTRGREAFPSPESWSALISSAASAPSAADLAVQIPRRAGSAGRGLQGKFSRPDDAGKHRIVPGACRLSSERERPGTRLCRRTRTNWIAPPESAACARHGAQDRLRSRPKGCRD